MSRKIHNLKFTEILQRIAEIIGAKNIKDVKKLADALGTTSQNISNWKLRNFIPWEELYIFAINRNVSFEWLLSGKQEEQSLNSRKANELEKIINHYRLLLEQNEKMVIDLKEQNRNLHIVLLKNKRADDPPDFDPKMVRKLTLPLPLVLSLQ